MRAFQIAKYSRTDATFVRRYVPIIKKLHIEALIQAKLMRAEATVHQVRALQALQHRKRIVQNAESRKPLQARNFVRAAQNEQRPFLNCNLIAVLIWT